jgi:hypothetical protein
MHALALVSSVAALLGVAGCTATPELLVRERASAELSCPAPELKVVCTGGIVFHMAEQYRCEARGCDKLGKYRCEAPLRDIGPFASRGDATCW